MNIDVVVDDVILILILTATNSHELVKASKRRENIWETNGSLLFLKWQGITFVLQII
jgi:hypothetical protein